jgi:hypothetical protein
VFLTLPSRPHTDGHIISSSHPAVPAIRPTPEVRPRGTGPLRRSPTLCGWAIVDRWRARQGVAVRARLVAPAIRTRPTLADCAFAIALKAQRSHALADRGEIVGGAGCVRCHVGPIIALPASDCCPAARLTMLSAGRARSFGQRRGLAVDSMTAVLCSRKSDALRVRSKTPPIPNRRLVLRSCGRLSKDDMMRNSCASVLVSCHPQ